MRRTSDRDVVVTGTGLVTPIGTGTAAAREALAAGRRAPGETARVEAPWLRAAVPEDLEAQSKFLNASGQMAVTAVAEAVAAARLADAGIPDAEKAFVLAQIDWTPTDFAAYRPAFEDATDRFTKPAATAMEALNQASVRKMNPFYLLETLNNNAFSFLSAWHGLRGSNTSLSGWSSPGLSAVALAARAVARGDARAAVACGAARLATPVAAMEMAHLGTLGEGARPGEGAGALVLEGAASARARGARPLAAVLGQGAAFGTRDPRGATDSALAAAMSDALAEAHAAAGDVAFVVAPDAARAAAAARAVPALAGVPVRSWRDAMGHAGPASDAMEAALAAAVAADTAGAILLLAEGLDGQAAALLLSRA